MIWEDLGRRKPVCKCLKDVEMMPHVWASLVAQMVKASACNVGDLGSILGLRRSPGEGHGTSFSSTPVPTQVLLPGKSQRLRSLVGCSLWGCKELDTTKQLTHTHMLNLLQYCFCFMFWFFGLKVRGILAPPPGIYPHPLHCKIKS